MGILVSVLLFWELVWKGLALWNSARRNHLIWFMFILVINSVGILPIIYLLIHKKDKKNKKSENKKNGKTKSM
ncbi:hypothetical protein K0A97_02245 [Patescibacteria group bacterium]|nr:hypothetical protein [Patescibacteria group bacterium]